MSRVPESDLRGIRYDENSGTENVNLNSLSCLHTVPNQPSSLKKNSLSHLRSSVSYYVSDF